MKIIDRLTSQAEEYGLDENGEVYIRSDEEWRKIHGQTAKAIRLAFDQAASIAKAKTSIQGPLKKGTWVKVTGREVLGSIVGYRAGDMHLPERERNYEIHVEQETLYFPPSRFEVVQEPPPERVALKERWERVADACRKFMESPSTANTQTLAEALSDVGLMKRTDE